MIVYIIVRPRRRADIRVCLHSADGPRAYYQAAYPMLVIVLVNIDRARGDGWEGGLSGATNGASTVRFADPGHSGSIATQVALSGLGGADRGEHREGEG